MYPMRLTSQAAIGCVAVYLAGVLSIAQTNSSIQRDGAFWAQTETGVIALGRAVALHLITEGNLSVRGETGATGQIRFTLTKRVRARSMPEAAALMREFQVRSVERGSVLHVS